MTPRLLPREERTRLPEAVVREIADTLPAGTQVVVLEDGDTIVANWLLLPTWHLEGLYCDPAYRRHAGVARQLLTAMQQLLTTLQVRAVFTTTTDPVTDGYLRRCFRDRFTELPGTTYVLQVGD